MCPIPVVLVAAYRQRPKRCNQPFTAQLRQAPSHLCAVRVCLKDPKLCELCPDVWQIQLRTLEQGTPRVWGQLVLNKIHLKFSLTKPMINAPECYLSFPVGHSLSSTILPGRCSTACARYYLHTICCTLAGRCTYNIMKGRKNQVLGLARAGAEADGLTWVQELKPSLRKCHVEGEKRKEIGSRGGSWYKCWHTNHCLDMHFCFSRMRKVWNVRIIWQTYIKILTNGWLPKSLTFYISTDNIWGFQLDHVLANLWYRQLCQFSQMGLVCDGTHTQCLYFPILQ